MAEWVAEPLTRWGYKAHAMIVEDDAQGTQIVKAEAALEGNTLVQQEGKPANTAPKPTPKGKRHPQSQAPHCKSNPNSLPHGGDSAEHFDGVVRTLE